MANAASGNNRQHSSDANSMTRKHRKPSRGGDDDEDSEVEMLSISSGDEDSSKDRVPPHQRGRGGGVGGRLASRDDEDMEFDDDDEPRSWKKVDEAELARKVREMRETRAAPASQIIDQKAAMARKGLTNLQSLPRGVEVLDPLGLGVIDNKSLRLITDASVSSPVSREKSGPLDPNIREKVIYSSPNFDPKVFLSRVHQETSAAALESSALTLKTDLKGRTQQKKQLVKENFDCFVSCKTTIDDIQSKLMQIEEDPEGAGTARLHEATERISIMANGAFQHLFERQAQAEKIRSVQGTLQRFRTLFNLPSTIRGSISKGEYDFAVREYRKAKSIVLPSHVGILKRVVEEVEKVMHEFRGTLYRLMEDPQLDLAELDNIVRLLLELEPDSDPIWHYLNIQNRRILALLDKCNVDHEAQMKVLLSEVHEKVKSNERWMRLQRESSGTSDLDSMVNVDVESKPIDLIGANAHALRGRYIRRLSAVIIIHMPAFWRLALSVFSGKFAMVAGGGALHESETNANLTLNKNEDRIGEVKYLSHTLEEVSTMVDGTVSAFEAQVHSTFRDLEESNILHSYMSDAISEIGKARYALEGKESAPPNAVKSLRALHIETTKIYVLRLCSWMRAKSKEVAKEEMWTPLTTLERYKSPYAISYLPLRFQEILISVMDRIDVMIQNLNNEASKSNNISDQIQEIRESVKLAFLNCFLDFAGCLEQIGSEISQSRPNKESMHTQNGYLHTNEKDSSNGYDNVDVADSCKKILIVLSNIGYCKDELSGSLYSKYRHIWLHYRDRDEQNADVRDLMASFSAIQEKVLEHYTYTKLNLIRSASLKYLLDSGIQWGGAPPVKGIRDATIDLLHILVAAHAEVFLCAKPLLEKVLFVLVEGLIDTFHSIFNENKNKELKLLDVNGFCQFSLELEYFDTVLHSYFSTEAREALKSLQEILLEKACESASETVENPGHHHRSTRGNEDAMSEDKQQGSNISPDDLIALAQQYSSDLFEMELERTRLNIACFMESSLQPTPPVAVKSAHSAFQGLVQKA